MVKFIPGSGGYDANPDDNGRGHHLVIDNIAHCNPIPVPPGLLLLGTGLAGLLALRRRS